MTQVESTSPEEKPRQNQPEDSQKTRGKLPFKVWFHEVHVPGRSNISPAHPLSHVDEIAGKFYSKYHFDTEVNDAILTEVLKSYEAGPREKYPEPLLESQRLGWYYDVKFTPIELLRDRRFNFHKRTSDIIKLEARIGAQKSAHS
ncbi:unnamed protein product [Bemisia tabaci]|uniref:Uncharacterized protein n=1 Tax=Bemisia tabaci TaxID=7038 RepID=A0A9P0G5B2_BEMTA|nr:unnamed protein product [Bemisia tabaci]